MRAVSEFIVDHSKKILIAMLVIGAICCCLIPSVTINKDMTKYLADSSQMKIGTDLLGEEFENSVTYQTIRVMFTNISYEEEEEVLATLEGMDYVESVEFDIDNARYHATDEDGNTYTLYVVSSDYEYDSTELKSLCKSFKSTFAGYTVTYATDEQSSGLPIWVMAIAMVVMMILLFAMCNSWLEPILFVAVIGLAVAINMGTNIVLGSISNVTFSIAAILQLALSMDYSIILANRFRQELLLNPDPKAAMKNAYHGAFSSVASSGMTTVVGLLMLVFMQFKIGQDLGVVLAKGVLISMICVFTALPGMILLCHKGIMATTKPHLEIPLYKMAGGVFKGRYIYVPVFLFLIIGGYFAQNMATIGYSYEEEDDISDIFDSTNSIVLLYSNEDEEAIADLVASTEDAEEIMSISSYYTTLGKEYTASEMADNLASLSDDIALDESVIDLLYYNYFAGDADLGTMTVAQFVTYIYEDLATNDLFADYIDDDMLAQLEDMLPYLDADELTESKTYADMADFLGMDEQDAGSIYLYYFITNGGISTGKMTIATFASFIVNEVAANEAYADMFDAETLAQLEQLLAYTDTTAMTTGLTYTQMATSLGIDAASMQLIYTYYYNMNASYSPGTMTLPAFIDFLLDDVSTNATLASYLDASTLTQLKAMQVYTDSTTITTKMGYSALATMFGMEESEVLGALVAIASEDSTVYSTAYASATESTTEAATTYYMTYYSLPSDEQQTEWFTQYFTAALYEHAATMTISPYDFVTAVLSNETILASMDTATITQLAQLQYFMQITLAGSSLSYADMAELFGMEAADLRMLYCYRDSATAGWTLSTQTVINFLVDNSTTFASALGDNLASLQLAQTIINSSINGTTYTYSAMASLLSMEADQAKQLYTLYTYSHGDTSTWLLDVQSFLDFILDEVLSSEDYASLIDADSAATLENAKVLIDAVIAGTTYENDSMAELLATLSDDLTANTVELVYLYKSCTENADSTWSISLYDLLSYLATDFINDSRFASLIEDDMKAQILDINDQIDEALVQLVGENYSILLFTTIYPEESETTTAFIEAVMAYADANFTGDYYLIGTSIMEYEMMQSFDSELLLITLLSALAIFVVVALTFRKILVPAMLTLVVQTAIFVTVATGWILDYSIFYMALLIVQCMLMGATIDYGILFTNYYRESRNTQLLPPREALVAAFKGATHTVLTSGLTLFFVTGVIAVTKVTPMLRRICQTVSIGAATAMILILFVMPGVLVALDPFIAKKEK